MFRPLTSTEVSQVNQALIISVLVHLVLVLLLERTPPALDLNDRKPIEIEIVDKPNTARSQQFVTDTNTGEVIAKADSPARFVSKDTRRVREESIASLSGPTQNSKQKGNKSDSKSRSRAEDLLRKENIDFRDLLPSKAESDIAVKARSREQANPGIVALLEKVSSISEYIPGVKNGHFTSLNTDQITYYTFFARINEQLRNRWTTNIRQASSLKSKSQLQQWGVQDRITELEIVLDKKGRFLKSRLFKASGVQDLDWAAIEAFRQSAPFTNPPQELIGDDGLVRLQYSFFVEWRSLN